MSHTIVVRLHTDCNASRAVTFLSVTLADVILRLCVACEIIGFLSVTDTFDAELLPRAKALGNYYYVGVSNIFFMYVHVLTYPAIHVYDADRSTYVHLMYTHISAWGLVCWWCRLCRGKKRI